MHTFLAIALFVFLSIFSPTLSSNKEFESNSPKVPQKNYWNLKWNKKDVIAYETTAIAIGEAVAREMYGDKKVDRFLPYSAYEEEYEGDKVWCVKGKPIVYVKGGYQVDGPIVIIRKYDGAILSVRYMN